MRTADLGTTTTMPTVDPPGRPRRSWTVVAAAVAALGSVAGLGINLLSDGGEPLRSENAVVTVPAEATTIPPATTVPAAPATTAPTPPTTARTTTATAPPKETLSANSRLSLDGIGPVDVGMTLDQASAAAGKAIRLNPSDPSDPYGPECQYAYPSGGPDELAFMVIYGRIARVDVGHMGPDRVKTVSGIGKGSTENDVTRTYPGRIRVEGHPYLLGGHYLVYTPADPGLAHLGMIFETDGSVVTSFRSGLKNAVSQIEGCS